MYLLFFIKRKKEKNYAFTEKRKKKKEIYKERMKKKKELFRIRTGRKRKNGANARACVRIHRQDSPRPFAAFQIMTNDRENPLTVFEHGREPFSFLNLTDRVLFSSIRADFVLFSKQKGKPDRARSPYACARVRICTQSHPPPTSENNQERRSCPFQALQGGYKPFYGRDR